MRYVKAEATGAYQEFEGELYDILKLLTKVNSPILLSVGEIRQLISGMDDEMEIEIVGGE